MSVSLTRVRKAADAGALAVLIVVGVTASTLPLAAVANGLGESASWQFRTSADRANLGAVADMIERKEGGFYDGFTTVVNNIATTNVGTQVNCNNTASAVGNQATNGQTGNAPVVEASGSIGADASGNVSDGTVGDGDGDVTSGQTNDGTVSSGVEGSSNDVQTGDVTTGANDAVLNNDQNNSGSQSAGVDDSIACELSGATISGDVVSDVDGSVSGPLN